MQLVSAAGKRALFTSLFNIYIHELTMYDLGLDGQMNEEGVYLPQTIDSFFSRPGYRPYIIYDEKTPTGFVVFSKQEPDSGEPTTCCIDEIFVLRTRRQRGIAASVVKDFLAQERGGVCGIAVLKENRPAVRFWENIIPQYDADYRRQESDGVYIYNFKI